MARRQFTPLGIYGTSELAILCQRPAANGGWVDRAPLIVSRIREIGVDRILYGSDAMHDDVTPKTMLAAVRQLPLSDAEFRAIESNIAPYMK